MIKKFSIWIYLGAIFLSLGAMLLSLEVVFKILSPQNKIIDKGWVQEHIHYNSDGFRDETITLQKPENIFRIMIIGDSQTFGHGIDRLADTFPKRLEKKLNDGLEFRRFEVLNFARPGWNANSYLQYLYKKGFDYHPDLIILNYFHNDVPPPVDFNCDSKDWNLIPSMERLEALSKTSALYGFLKFRVNRLLEKTGSKPTYQDCLREIYASRGWDMAQLYLDTIIQSSRMRRIHIMMTVLPVLYKLKESYPFAFAHEKLEEFCDSRQISCLDMYSLSFKNLDAEELIISGQDRHLNEAGAEMVAKTLFKTLEPLKVYTNLKSFSQAFVLEELLKKEGVVFELDKRFSEIETSFMTFKKDDTELVAWGEQGQNHFIKTRFEPGSQIRSLLSEMVLEREGVFLKSEKKFFDVSTGKILKKEDIEIKEGQWNQIQFSPNKPDQKIVRKFVFGYYSEFYKKLDQFVWHLEIEKDSRFNDPLTFESSVFYPEKLKLPTQSRVQVFETLKFYQIFPFFMENSGRRYANRLAQKIVQSKPNEDAVAGALSYLDSVRSESH